MKIAIGKIVKPQGVKGEMKIYPADPDLSIYKNVHNIYIENGEMIAIKKLIARQGFLYLTLPNVNDRNVAETYRNKTVYCNQEDIVLPEDTYFIDDFISKSVVDGEGNYIGTVTDIENYGSADIITILEGDREYTIPFLTSIIIKVTDDNIIVDKKRYDEVKICE